jgi:hypothetical protein
MLIFVTAANGELLMMLLSKKLCALILSIIIVLHSHNSMACDRMMKGLTSSKGLAAVGLVYGATSAVSNFIWAFNWAKHTNMDPDSASTLQEWGGISAAIENILLGVFIPLAIYELQKLQPPAPLVAAPNAGVAVAAPNMGPITNNLPSMSDDSTPHFTIHIQNSESDGSGFDIHF